MKPLLVIAAAWGAWQLWLRSNPSNVGAVVDRLGHPLSDVLVWPIGVKFLRAGEPDYQRPDEGGPG